MRPSSSNWSDIPISGKHFVFQNRVGMNFRFNFSPYKVDENYVRLDEYCLPRMTFASVSTNFSITEKDFMKKKEGDSDPKVDKTKSDSEGDYDKDGYMLYAPKWNISFSYTYSYSKTSINPVVTNSVGVNGSLEFSKNWSMSVNTGYDFQAQKDHRSAV